MMIAVFTKNWLGDVIFESPAIRTIKENDPTSHLVAVTHPRCVELLEANPYVDEVISFDSKAKHKRFFSQLKFAFKLRKHRIDKVYLFHRSLTHARVAWLAGIRERIGYDTKRRHLFLTHAIPEGRDSRHDVQYFVDLLRASGLKTEGEYPYEFYFDETDRAAARSLVAAHQLRPERLVAMSPGANWPPKRWPAEYFRRLADQLISRYNLQIVLTGNEEDQPIVSAVLDSRPDPRLISVCGKTSVRQLGALFSMCRLVIANDTGPLHVAAGVGTNVVGLFGPTAPRETAPLGRGRNVIIHYAPAGVKLPWMGKDFPAPWMELIPVDLVLRTIEKEKLLER
ncbi:MAG: lipopolysaccharide heptosyltransferase II [Candidatus Omnitrophica bacterium]|nr:lipopolysaccharide heptosyltransferase II [Candidatus Omnitrophota bacterium]